MELHLSFVLWIVQIGVGRQILSFSGFDFHEVIESMMKLYNLRYCNDMPEKDDLMCNVLVLRISSYM